MPSIYINEIDRTAYSVTNNESDNIVYIVGSAIKGKSKTAVLCRNYNEFVAEFGTKAPAQTDATYGGAWDYATNLLLGGFPVLFRRITSYKSGTTTVEISTASTTEYKVTVSEEEVVALTATSKGVGTYQNGTSVRFSYTPSTTEDTSVTVAIAQGKVTENFTVCEVPANSTDAEVFALIASNITTVASTLVTFTVNSELATFSLPSDWNTTAYTLSGATDATSEQIKSALIADFSDIFGELKDRDLFDVKFLTLGGLYFGAEGAEVIQGLVDVASNSTDGRQDCIAVLDTPPSLTPTEVKAYFDTTVRIDTSYATAYDPWVYFQLAQGAKWMPPSFVFLYELAKSINSGNRLWLPPAGVNRGLVPEAVKTYREVGSVVSASWQDTVPFINPIRVVRNYGYAIFGQKTLLQTVGNSSGLRSAFQDLSVRLTANEIKRKIRDISISLTFEENNLRTWNSFIGALDPYLTQIASDGALDDFEIIMDNTVISEEDINNNTVRGVVIVKIARASEDFKIDFIVTNDSAEFSEDEDIITY